jgi:hypothetical protein
MERDVDENVPVSKRREQNHVLDVETSYIPIAHLHRAINLFSTK